ncbi:MAG: DUF2892 domain-containing protein [Candidatus Aegiribacteria sp.]|nr:DUF2892 domain-containing protein [Candidatus Aegiribacteria sp.]MBD3295294.1 DUF2892 domain-containing protein [Candidatus Fermentibacteria bacterium]
MRKNIGKTDRIVRTVLAAVIFLLLVMSRIRGTFALILGIVAAALIFTVVTGFCSLYVPFGISTLRRKEDHAHRLQDR